MRKILALLLALLLILNLSACGNAPSDSSSPVVTVSQTTAASSTTAAAVTTKARPLKTTTTATTAATPTVVNKEWYTPGDVTITKAEVNAVMSQTYQKPKNVIVMIADGMGPNDIVITEKYSDYCYDFGLILNQFKYHGLATTHNANGGVTDSAAAATALATGVKTNNTSVGMSQDGKTLKNISEIAREHGKKVGIVTNDLVTGATPSGFTVHALSREATGVLAREFVDFAPDVLIGQNYTKFITNLSQEHKAKLTKNFLLATTFHSIPITLNIGATDEKPLLGFYDENLLGDPSNYLAYSTEIALNRLDGDAGFFLMVEGAGTDKAGHNNVMSAKMNSVITFERALAVVLKYMKTHPDTLLIVTSDHETGGVQLPAAGEQPSNDLFTSESHTGQNVRVFALGYGAEYFHNKTVDNTDIAKFAISAVKGEMK